jgi:antirestriction protein ArdC
MALDVYEVITAKFIDALSKGVVPWRRPWNGSDAPHNYVSKKDYSGGNIWLLNLAAASAGYEHSAWMTYNQAQALGANVRKGEKSTAVYFWKASKYSKTDKTTGESEEKRSLLLRYYNVFNVAQIEGLKTQTVREIAPLEAPQAIFDSWCIKPPLQHRGAQASYSPAKDIITMPPRHAFKDAESYYATLFHESIHATGHESRLDRGFAFYGERYAKEELVAEIGAAYLCNRCGIDSPEIDTSTTAYLQSWIKVLKGDSRLILSAASAAQKAADNVLNVVKQVEATEDATEDRGDAFQLQEAA